MPRSRYSLVLPAVLVLLAVLLLPVGPAAASLYKVDVGAYDGSNLVCGGALDFQSEPFPVTSTATVNIGDVVGTSSGAYDAIASLGYVGMKQHVSHQVNPGWGRIFGTCSSVSTVIDDLQVVGPPGQITASLNADLLARIEADTLSMRSHLRVTVSLRSTQQGTAATNTVDIDF